MSNNNVNAIVIGGYTLEELKKVQEAVRKDANKIIAEAIKTATGNMDELLAFSSDDEEPYTEEEKSIIIAKAKEAAEALTLADIVSGISGVSYYLTYNTDWSSDGYFYQFESCDNGQELFELIDDNSTMFGKLEEMEYKSRNWHQSTC
jgi:hypothetical protein